MEGRSGADRRAKESDLLARVDEARRAVAAQQARVTDAAERLRVAQQTADAARRAGNKHATNAVAASNKVAPPSNAGLYAEV